jgi:hypothetical protein
MLVERMTTGRSVTRSVLALATLAAACDGALPAPCEGSGCGTQVSIRRTFQRSVNRQVDLLFVVDDTPAAVPYREAILKGIDDMTSALVDTSPPLSLHAGVVRAGGCDASTRGVTCAVQSAEQFVRTEWCNTITNVSGALPETVTCLADLGAENCAPATPLSAALQALEGTPRPGWEGFLRPDAYLMLVVISAEDDASGQSGALSAIVDVAARTKSLKGDPSAVLVSMIGSEACVEGVPGRSRLCQFADQFGANGLYLRLGSGSLAPAVQRLTENTNIGLRSPCIANVRDVDADAPGLQPNCTVTRSSLDATGALVTSSLPTCDGNQLPCWSMGPTIECSGGGEVGYPVDIQSESTWCFDGATTFTIECLSCADPNDPACATSR